MRRTVTAALAAGAAALSMLAPAAAPAQDAAAQTAAEANAAPYMNAFRRFRPEDQEAIFDFYSEVVGLEPLATFASTAVTPFQHGPQQLKFNPRAGGRTYVDGGVEDATGVRLFSFFYPDEETIAARFEDAGLPAPDFVDVPGSTRSIARVTDPGGMPLELVAAPGEDMGEVMEVGLTVSDLEESRDFYENFVGLTGIAPEEDPISGVTKTRYRNGSTIISLRSFGGDLPADTGGGGIQHITSDAALINEMAMERGVTIDQPLSTLEGYDLKTVWLDDPDGITNYFAQVGASSGD